MLDEPESVEDRRYTEWFGAHEEALVTGESPTVDMPATSPELERQLARDLACARMLRQVLRPVELPTRDLPWTSLGRFQIRRELGRGSFGIVFLAHDPLLGREVAVKVPRPEVVAIPGSSERFRVEARAAAGLDHPNLVPVHEAGEVGPVCYIVSAYCPGVTLAQWLRQHSGLLPFREAASLCLVLAEAVGHAHARGVVHRDLKPGNVLLSAVAPDVGNEPSKEGATTGQRAPTLANVVPRITDFGLAKLEQEGVGGTRSGVVMGTPAYMSPEQASGKSKHVGASTDVYALGAILYELLTGRPPFMGESDLETLLQIQVDDPVPPSRLRSRLPRDLETICLKCLEKGPTQRYESASGLVGDLQRFLDGLPILARPVSRLERLGRWCRRNPVVAALVGTVALLLLLVSLGSTLAAWRQAELSRKAEQARQQSEQANHEALAARDREKIQRLRAEGMLVREYLARGWRLADGGDLAGSLPWFAEVLRLEQGRPGRESMHRYRLATVMRQVPALQYAWFHEDEVRSAAFSPDGKRVVIASDDWTARIWDTTTGCALTPPLLHEGEVTCARFSPAGRRVATAAHAWDQGAHLSEVRLWDAATGRMIVSPLRGIGYGSPTVTFSSDGKWVAAAGKEGAVARVWDAATGQAVTPPLDHGDGISWIAFGPDGRLLVTAGHDGCACTWDLPGGKLRHRLKHGGVLLHGSLHPEGGRLVTCGTDFKARVWDTVTGQQFLVLDHTGNVAQGRYSPDGRTLLTTSHDRMVRLWESVSGKLIWTRQHGDQVRIARFTPDGRRIIVGGSDGVVQTWNVATGTQGLLIRHGGPVHDVNANADGSLILTASADGTARLHRSPALRKSVLPQSAFARYVVYSGDGRLVATCAGATAQVWHTETGGRIAGPLTHAKLVTQAVFSPDGRLLVTASQDGTARTWEADTGRLRNTARHEGEVRTVEFSPDGRTVLTAADRPAGSHLAGSVSLWDTTSGMRLRPELAHPSRVVQATFHPDGARFLVGCEDGRMMVYDTGTGKLAMTLTHEANLGQAFFSRDGSRILSRSRREMLIWDAESGKQASPAMRPQSLLRHAAFSPDGRRVVTTSDDGTARIWDVATGRLMGQPMGHALRGLHAVFSPDGGRLVTTSDDRSARLWDGATGEALSAGGEWHSGWVYHAAFHPSGRELATAGAPPGVALWDVSGDDRPVEDLKQLAELLAAQKLTDQGTVPMEPEQVRAAWLRLWQKYPEQLPSAPIRPPDWEGRQHHRQGRDHALVAQWDRAITQYTSAIRLLPDDPGLRLERAYAYRQVNQEARARADLERVIQLDSDHKEVHQLTGLRYASQGKWREAVPRLARAIELGSNDIATHSNLGFGYVSLAQYDRAIRVLTQVLQQAPDNAAVLTYRSMAYTALDREDLAADDDRRAIELGCSDGWVWFRRASYLRERGDRDAQRRLYRDMNDQLGKVTNSTTALYLVRTGLLLPEESTTTLEVLRRWEKLLRTHHDQPSYRFVRALAHLRAGQLQEAILWADRALSLSAGIGVHLPQIYLVQTLANHRLGRIDQARQRFALARAAIRDNGELAAQGAGLANFYVKGHRQERLFLLREAEAVLESQSRTGKRALPPPGQR